MSNKPRKNKVTSELETMLSELIPIIRNPRRPRENWGPPEIIKYRMKDYYKQLEDVPELIERYRRSIWIDASILRKLLMLNRLSRK